MIRREYIPVVSNWFIKGLVLCKTIYDYIQTNYPLESIEKRSELSPACDFCLSPICP